jgi:tetratricopeptide (TPR) repeat protein
MRFTRKTFCCLLISFITVFFLNACDRRCVRWETRSVTEYEQKCISWEYKPVSRCLSYQSRPVYRSYQECVQWESTNQTPSGKQEGSKPSPGMTFSEPAGKDHISAGITYEKAKKYDLAINEFTKAIELDPGYYLSYIDRGEIYMKVQKYDQAITDFTKALEIAPNNWVPLALRGEVYCKLNNYEQANADVKKVLSLEKNAPTMIKMCIECSCLKNERGKRIEF